MQYAQAALLEENNLAFLSGAANMNRHRDRSESPPQDLVR